MTDDPDASVGVGPARYQAATAAECGTASSPAASTPTGSTRAATPRLGRVMPTGGADAAGWSESSAGWVATSGACAVVADVAGPAGPSSGTATPLDRASVL